MTMIDQAQPPPVDVAPAAPAAPLISMNSTARIVFGCIFLAFFSGIIVYLILYGKADNSLHSSALAWCFLGDIGILAAFGFGGIAEYLPYVFAKK